MPGRPLSSLGPWLAPSRPTVAASVSFARRGATLDDVREVFRRSYVERIRVGVIYFTERGEPSEKLPTPSDTTQMAL